MPKNFSSPFLSPLFCSPPFNNSHWIIVFTSILNNLCFIKHSLIPYLIIQYLYRTLSFWILCRLLKHNNPFNNEPIIFPYERRPYSHTGGSSGNQSRLFALPQPTCQFGHDVLLVLLAHFGQIYYLFSMFQKGAEQISIMVIKYGFSQY